MDGYESKVGWMTEFQNLAIKTPPSLFHQTVYDEL